MAQQQIRSSLIVVPVSRQRDGGESDTTRVSERSSRSRANVRSLANGFIKPPANGVISDQGVRASTEAERNRPTDYVSTLKTLLTRVILMFLSEEISSVSIYQKHVCWKRVHLTFYFGACAGFLYKLWKV